MAVKSVEEITAELRALNRVPQSVGSLTSGVQSSTSEDKEDQNRGGVIGGVGYVGEKTGLGFLSTIEGAVDYTTGTIAKVIADITGNSDILDWGKSQFTEDWVNYNHADEWYNPSEGWKIAGDVGSGIGNSLAIVGVSALTGSPAAGMVFSGLGAAGNATKEAVLKTGELTGKEIAYGAMSGATEILMEKASSALGIGTQRIVRSVTKRFGKEAVESVVKPSFKQLVKNIGEDFLSEAFEEGTQEILEQHYKRWTYDETAKNASVKEVEYAAIVGGLSGAVMSGGHAAITTTGNILSGNTSIKNGTVDQILDNAKRIAEIEDSSDTGYEVFRSIRDQYRELSQSLPADGNYTIKQRAQLGSLKRAEVAAAFVPELERSAIKVINSAEEMAQYVNDLGLKKADGSKLTVTAEDIRGGIDPNATGKKALKEFRKQIETNPLLTTLATMDAVGRLQANAAQMQKALENGTASGNRFYQSAQQLNALREKATPEQLAAIGKVLGISDWATVNAEEFAKKVQKVGKEEQQRAAERQNAVETAPTPVSAESAGGTEGAFGSAVPAGGMYALKEQNPVDGYTEQQYNSFGWVRSNGILTSEQYNDFSSKFADIKSGRVKGTPVSKDGYYMIAVGGLTDGTGFGVDNIVVLAKGSLENPEIGCIYEIYGENENDFEKQRRIIYESERRGVQPEAGELFRRYLSSSFIASENEKNRIQSDGYRSGNGNGGGSRPQAERAAKRIVEYDFENGTVTYADGIKEADPDSTKQESRDGSEKEAADRRSPETGKSDLPESLSSLPYGARRYQIGGNDFILIKTDRNGYDGYEIRDNESGRWSKVLDRAQAEKVLKSIKTASETAQNTELSSALKSAGEYAEKNIPEYRRLMEPGKAAVRNTIMQARVYGLSDADVKLYARISSKSGLNIVFDPKLGIYEDSKGYYNNGTVFVDPNEGKESSFRKILAHENGHALIEAFPKLGRKIERFALKHIDTEKRNRTIELYRNYFGDHISKEALLDEINSAYSEELAETESFWEFLLADEPTVKEKVLSFFGKSAQKYSFEEGLSREARKYMTMYRKMFNRFSEINRGNNSFAGDALIRSDNAKKGEDNINYYDKEITGKRYNLRDDFGQQIRDWLSGGGKKNGSFNGRYFDLGTTPDVLIKHGAKHLPVVMFEDCMVKITGGKGDDAHSFSIDELSKLPEALNDPILLFKGSYPDSFVALTELTDKSGNDSVVAIHLNKVLDRTVINKIASIYSKTNEYGINKIKNYVYHQIENGNLLDASTKKAPNWFTSRGLQLPKLVQTILDASRSDGETVDHKIRLTSSATTGNSISQTSEKINTSEKKISEISEKNPDIRRSLKDDADISERRSAAASKLIANYNRQRMYNKADAEAVRNKALEEVFREYLDQDSSVDMSRKASETLDSYLLEQLNTAEPGERSDYALKAADYAIRNLIIQRSESDADTESMESASVTYAQLKKYLHSMDLSGIRDDIRTGFGERAKTVLSMWSKKGGITPGAAARELADAGIRIDAQSESEIFREIVDLYEMNRDAAKKKVEKITLESFASEEEYRNIRQKFASSLLRAADETGSESKYARLRRQYLQETEQLKTLLRDGGERNRAINRVIYSAERFRDTKNGAFTNATEIGSQEFLKIAGELSRVLSRGNLNSRAAISALQKLYNHYTSQDIKKSLEAKGIYSEDLANLLNEITTEGDASESALAEAALRMYQARNAEELDLENINDCRKLRDWYSKKNLGDSYDLSTKIALQHFADQNYISTGNLRKMAMVIDGFAHLIKSYNKAFFRGRWVDASEMASSFVSDIQKNSNIKRSPLTRIMESRYMRTFADPMVLARWMDRYNDNGFFSSMLADLRDGAIRESILDMDIRRGIDDFYRKNKSWRKEIQNTIVPFNGADLTKAEAMQLYMTLHRDQAIPGILYNGFELREGKDRIRVSGIVDPDADISEAELRKIAEKTASQLESSFSETDKQYIAIVETVYQQCRQLKYETDIARQGFSNVQDGYYVPLARANIAHSIDADYIGESMSVTNQSFNKNTVKGAKGELMILPIDQVVDRHISGITKYAALASAMDSFDMLFNLDVSGNKNKAVSIATETELVWSDYFKYMQNLRNDLRGLSRDTDGLNRIFGKMRGKYATAVLGMNVKVLATQFSSLFASTSILSPKNIIRGMTIDSSMVDQYCRIAEVRNYDQTAALAQSVTEKLDGIGDLLTKPIGMFDRLNVRVLFGACQAQIASDGGPKIGTEENRIAAGKLLERVILETQQNATATDRSAAMRSGSEVMKSFTMFTADSMKVVGRLFDAVGKRSVLSDRLSNAQSAAEKSEIRKEIRTANKQLAKSVGAIVSSSVYMAILAQAFRWIYGKDDDKEKIPENIVLDSFGNMLGGLPIISDAYDYIVNGFEFGDSNYDMLNDLAEATKKGFRVIGDAVSGEADSKEALTAVKSIVFSASKFLGLPAQNLWNLSYGAIKRTMPRAAYLIDDAFKSQSYRKDLSAAIEAGDEEMAETVLNVWAKNKLGKFEKEETAEAIKELLKNGYSVLPKTIGDSISVNGTEYELSANDKKLFSSVYGGYTDELDSMIGSQAFSLLNKQAQAKAINTVYDSYYNRSVKSVLGLDSNSTVSLAEKFLGLSDYAIANAAISSMTAETDKQGKAISGTKKKKVIAYLLRQNMTDEERLLILVLSGYSIQDGDFKNMTASAAKKKLLKYILNRSGATANEKIALCNKIGFEVKNGKISASSIK